MPLKSYLLPVLAFFAFTFTACKKNPKAGEPAPQEEGLVVTLTDVVENEYTASPGSTYTFKVNVTSEMPAKGVLVEVTAVTDPGGIPVPQNAIAVSKEGTISVTLVGLEALRTVKVTIVVTSQGKSSNVKAVSFWITNKEPQ